MNKKHFLAAVLAFCLMLTLCACGGEEAATKTGEPDTAPSAATTPSGDVTPSGDTTPSNSASADAVRPTAPTPADGEVLYTVKVVDKDGNPKEGAFVQMCLEACVFKTTDVAGYAYFCMAEADYKVTLMDDGTAPAGYTAKEHHFEAGSYEMTLVYDYAAENVNGTEEEPMFNDVELDWGE